MRRVLSYGHLGFISAVIAVAVGLGEAIRHPGDPLQGAEVALLFGGGVLYLATFGYTRWAMFGQLSTTRLTAAAVVAAISPTARLLPAVASVALLAAVVTGLNAIEASRVSRRAGSG